MYLSIQDIYFALLYWNIGSNLKGKINPIVAETIPASSAAIEAKKNLDDPVPSSSRGNEQKSLFLDDEEDIFANSAFVTKRKDSGSSSQANIPSTITAPPSMPSGNLPKQGKQKQGLFGSDSDSDDLFKASVSAKSSKPKTKPKDETSKSNKLSDSSTSKSLKPSVKSSAITNKSIFDDSSDEGTCLPQYFTCLKFTCSLYFVTYLRFICVKVKKEDSAMRRVLFWGHQTGFAQKLLTFWYPPLCPYIVAFNQNSKLVFEYILNCKNINYFVLLTT